MTAVDPVCGMEVHVAADTPRCEHEGQEYCFCCDHCLERFREDPDRYLARSPATAQPGSAVPVAEDGAASGEIHTCPMHPEVRQEGPGTCPDCGMALEPELPAAPAARTEYTCPMHPEVVRDEPGSCPDCGMALEPRTVTAEDEPNPELIDMSRRFRVCLLLTLPVLFLAMAEMGPGQSLKHALGERLAVWLQFLLSTPVVLWGGWPFFQRGWASLVNRSLNMFTLIAIGTGAAYSYSVVATLLPGIFPPSFRGIDGVVAIYFEAAAVITTLVLLGQVLELRARSRTGEAIKALLGLAPASAVVVRSDGVEEETPLEQVETGSLLRVRPEKGCPSTALWWREPVP